MRVMIYRLGRVILLLGAAALLIGAVLFYFQTSGQENNLYSYELKLYGLLAMVAGTCGLGWGEQPPKRPHQSLRAHTRHMLALLLTFSLIAAA